MKNKIVHVLKNWKIKERKLVRFGFTPDDITCIYEYQIYTKTNKEEKK